MKTSWGSWVEGHEVAASSVYTVVHKYTGDPLAEVAEADADLIDRAVLSAERALKKPVSVHRRAEILEKAAVLLGEEAEDMALTMAREAGKPLKDARAEVARGQQTLRYSSVAARTLHGEEVPVRGNPGSEGRVALTLRKPYGVVLAITPFNFPLNLVLHKVGPALAGGNAVVLKPAPATPLTALKLARIFQRAGLPDGWLNVVTGARAEIGAQLVAHPGVKLISFTGSAAVGQTIRKNAGLRPVLLELGNNSANIVHRDADLEMAARVLAARAYGYAGQVCISVQRMYVERSVYQPFKTLLTEAVRNLKVGNPEDPETDVGPMISEAAAERAMAWTEEALGQGARAVLSGTRSGPLVAPVLLENVAPSMQVMAEEVFAPLAGLVPYDEFSEAIAWANQSRYGLQAGVFTQSLDVAFQAAQQLEVGGVMINDSSAYRADNMPYGGVKDSGIGREGPEHAILEMTYPTVMVVNLRG
ncbi:aldehyde dehydrogenase family protein [Sulfobacillus harzensis]|uniref:Aldehyde dehydrogenase family protein n=1 Tax=Sulfobacillus harzensis TaxID=2729629 RepID=A0A7Y0Q3L6_9FIRM|nr:aldehyde dehydrogenase family protein [Sulfobacillus harzensis]NMP23116.1 aldehyde dehydrogenase family protein [Sulfobacillus harzensis]